MLTGPQWKNLRDGYRFDAAGVDGSIILQDRQCACNVALW
jgi:hypothetical protein